MKLPKQIIKIKVSQWLQCERQFGDRKGSMKAPGEREAAEELLTGWRTMEYTSGLPAWADERIATLSDASAHYAGDLAHKECLQNIRAGAHTLYCTGRDTYRALQSALCSSARIPVPETKFSFSKIRVIPAATRRRIVYTDQKKVTIKAELAAAAERDTQQTFKVCIYGADGVLLRADDSPADASFCATLDVSRGETAIDLGTWGFNSRALFPTPGTGRVEIHTEADDHFSHSFEVRQVQATAPKVEKATAAKIRISKFAIKADNDDWANSIPHNAKKIYIRFFAESEDIPVQSPSVNIKVYNPAGSCVRVVDRDLKLGRTNLCLLVSAQGSGTTKPFGKCGTWRIEFRTTDGATYTDTFDVRKSPTPATAGARKIRLSDLNITPRKDSGGRAPKGNIKTDTRYIEISAIANTDDYSTSTEVFKISILKPSGELVRHWDSPVGFTYTISQTVGHQTLLNLGSFGSQSGDQFAAPGVWTVQVTTVAGDVFSAQFEVKPKKERIANPIITDFAVYQSNRNGTRIDAGNVIWNDAQYITPKITVMAPSVEGYYRALTIHVSVYTPSGNLLTDSASTHNATYVTRRTIYAGKTTLMLQSIGSTSGLAFSTPGTWRIIIRPDVGNVISQTFEVKKRTPAKISLSQFAVKTDGQDWSNSIPLNAQQIHVRYLAECASATKPTQVLTIRLYNSRGVLVDTIKRYIKIGSESYFTFTPTVLVTIPGSWRMDFLTEAGDVLNYTFEVVNHQGEPAGVKLSDFAVKADDGDWGNSIPCDARRIYMRIHADSTLASAEPRTQDIKITVFGPSGHSVITFNRIINIGSENHVMIATDAAQASTIKFKDKGKWRAKIETEAGESYFYSFNVIKGKGHPICYLITMALTILGCTLFYKDYTGRFLPEFNDLLGIIAIVGISLFASLLFDLILYRPQVLWKDIIFNIVLAVLTFIATGLVITYFEKWCGYILGACSFGLIPAVLEKLNLTHRS